MAPCAVMMDLSDGSSHHEEEKDLGCPRSRGQAEGPGQPGVLVVLGETTEDGDLAHSLFLEMSFCDAPA